MSSSPLVPGGNYFIPPLCRRGPHFVLQECLSVYSRVYWLISQPAVDWAPWRQRPSLTHNSPERPNGSRPLEGQERVRRRQWPPAPVLLPGKSHGQRSLVGCSPWGREESDRTEWLHFHFSLLCIEEGNGNPLQGSCLENPRDGAAQSQTRLKWLSSKGSGNVSCVDKPAAPV